MKKTSKQSISKEKKITRVQQGKLKPKNKTDNFQQKARIEQFFLSKKELNKVHKKEEPTTPRHIWNEVTEE